MRRFADLNPLGRAIIIAVALGTLGIAAGAFFLSYGALYAWVQATGIYADAGPYAKRLEQLWPLMLDAAFIIAELAAILGGILRGPRGWPILVMVLTGTLTVVFNVLHVATPAARVAAALPPILMMACFQIDLAIVGWVMRALGRSDGGVPPGAFLGVPQATPLAQVSSVPRSTIGHTGQWGSGAGGGEATKRAAIETAAATLGHEEVTAIGPEGVAVYLAEHHGVQTTPGYVRKVLEGRVGAPSPNGKGHP
jgi:peptidoglycan/LPS O-acetylase OafA/YrhL